MNIKFWEKKKAPPREPQVTVAGFGEAILISASSTGESNVVLPPTQRSIRQIIGVREAVWDPATSVKLNVPTTGAEYPSDFSDYPDYLDAYCYVPFVARALDIKNHYVWQAGYDLEGKDAAVEKADRILQEVNADTFMRQGSLWASVFGNFYWRIANKQPLEVEPLNPLGIGVTHVNDKTNYIYKPDFKIPEKTFKEEEILHLKYIAEPWNSFGYGTLRRILSTVKQILYMEKHLPEIARQRADPWLSIKIIDPVTQQPYPDATFQRVKAQILGRKPGENLIHGGDIEVAEIYQAASVGGRQTLEGILGHFEDNLVAGLGVPAIYLGAASTTLKGTAEHQEVGIESEVRSIQRDLKRFHEQSLFPLLGIEDVKLIWRPLKPEDLNEISKRLMAEIEHAVVTPEYAQDRLGYPDDMDGEYLMSGDLFPANLKAGAPENEPAKPESA